MTEKTATPGPVPARFLRLAQHTVASGLTPLIPVPFLDEYALRRVRERMVRALLTEHGLPSPDKAVEVLAGSHVRPGGRLLGLLRSMALAPLKSIFRKVFFVLWVKDCVDAASSSLHQGYLLQHALERGHLDARGLEREEVPLRVHAAIDAACQEVDARPINQLMRRLFASSRLLLAEATRALEASQRGVPRAPQEGEAQEVRSLAERLAAALWEERGYFESLERRYEEHLRRGQSGPAEGSSR